MKSERKIRFTRNLLASIFNPMNFRGIALALCLLAATNAAGAGEKGIDTRPASMLGRYALIAEELALRALSHVGVSYRRGGESPQTGFDCSGLVRHVVYETLGLVLPRTSRDISRLGETVRREELRPGDLVFFNTLRRGFSHVGIYLGEHRFVHAPASGGEVRIEDMRQSYWAKRFNGARRLAAAEVEATSN